MSHLPRNKRNAPAPVQIKSLHRVATRALAQADHLADLLRNSPSLFDPEETAAARIEVGDLRRKAEGAAQEMLAIAKASGDPRAARFTGIAGF